MSFSAYPEQINRLDKFYYRIAITNSFSGGTEGFVDHLSPNWYGDNTSFPTTTATALTKERSNMRFERLIVELSENISPIAVVQINNNGATNDTEGTAFEFTVGYDREEYIYTYNELFGTAHATGTTEILETATDAIKRQVARVFVKAITENREIYNPTATGNTAQIISVTADSLVADADLDDMITTAEAAITVTANTSTNQGATLP